MFWVMQRFREIGRFRRNKSIRWTFRVDKKSAGDGDGGTAATPAPGGSCREAGHRCVSPSRATVGFQLRFLVAESGSGREWTSDL